MTNLTNNILVSCLFEKLFSLKTSIVLVSCKFTIFLIDYAANNLRLFSIFAIDAQYLIFDYAPISNLLR